MVTDSASSGQISLFDPPARGVRPTSPPPEEFTPLGAIVQEFLARREVRAQSIPRCDVCGCTEADPCRLADGESCLLQPHGRVSHRCTAPHCRKAA